MKNKIKRIAVIGAGNGGHAAAADLSLAGFQVNLYDHPKFSNNIESILAQKGIKITGAARNGFAKINLATTNMKEAVEDVELILIVVPAFAHEIMFETVAPYLEDGQIIVIMPGNYGALQLANILKRKEIQKDVLVAETSTLVYTCRLIKPAEVRVNGVKGEVLFAALPSKMTKKCIRIVRQLYPQFEPVSNVFATSLSAVNMVLHPPIMLLNAGLIERTKGDFLFYIHGGTPSVVGVIEKLDAERIAVGEALGASLPSVKDMLFTKYGSVGATLYDAIQDTKPYWDYSAETAPSSLKSRYLNEDVPYGLVPLASLGRMLDVPTPIVNTIIDLASIVNRVDYRKSGFTLEEIGLAGMNLQKIKGIVT